MRNLLSLLLVFGLVVSACAETTTEDSTATSTDGGETTTSASEGTTTSAAPETTTTTAAPTASGGECLIGTWVLDTGGFVENFASIFADAGMPDAEVTALDGTMTVEFMDNGSLEGTRDGWGFTFATDEGGFTIEVNGTETGTWSVDQSNLTVNVDESNLDVTTSIEVDGEVMELPQGNAPINVPTTIASNSTFTCSGDVMTISSAGVESVFNRT